MTVDALVMYNTVDMGFSTWEEVEALQKLVKDPAVVFVDADTKRPLHIMEIAADSEEDMDFMVKNRFFYTTSVPAGTYEVIDGRVFYGVDQDNKKTASANWTA
jgi:uncharacterized ferredoxin-like protein